MGGRCSDVLGGFGLAPNAAGCCGLGFFSHHNSCDLVIKLICIFQTVCSSRLNACWRCSLYEVPVHALNTAAPFPGGQRRWKRGRHRKCEASFLEGAARHFSMLMKSFSCQGGMCEYLHFAGEQVSALNVTQRDDGLHGGRNWKGSRGKYVTRMTKGLEGKLREERPREGGVLRLEKRRLMGARSEGWKGCLKEEGENLSSLAAESLVCRSPHSLML